MAPAWLPHRSRIRIAPASTRYELQIFAWGLWIGGFLAIVPGVGAAWDSYARPALPPHAPVRVVVGLALGYALSLLATSLGNWTADGAGWQLQDAGFAKQSFCYSAFVTAGALAAHAVAAAVTAALDLCYLGSHFPAAVVMAALSWVSEGVSEGGSEVRELRDRGR